MLFEIKEQLHRSVVELEQANTKLNSELDLKTEDIHNLKRDLEENVKKSQELQKNNGQLAERIKVLTRPMCQKAEADKEVAVLSQALKAAKSELKNTQDKVVFLIDENKVILQEKAVIKGQFKQLQESLQARD